MTVAVEELAAVEDEIARRAVELTYERLPELAEAYRADGRAKCLEDFRFHLRFLLSSLVIDDDGLFADYAAWARALLERFGIPPGHLAVAFAALGDAIAELVPDAREPAARALGAGTEALGD